ncbi:hypothetical protein [Halomonas sp. DN3]|uniref:hypothetical protein n=1 Tax=Halomonas sp. DN3 TaxID=2953657 RepID=UPI00209DC5FE|nr:hypothetical protein [Halomonas sp. DN3]USZ48097.1 hypothetical protein NKF27_11210 [Halomonas sp. DN3]
MTAVAEKESTELVTVPSKETALEVFKADKGLDPYLAAIREELDAFLAEPPTLDTAKGRQAYASMAHKIARSKTAIDNIGKELVADLKQLPKTIDAERKRWRDQLDAWRDEARGPLNEWEAAEEARKEKHEAGIRHIRDCAMGLIGGEPQPYGLLFRELEEKVVIDESWEEYEAEAHRAKADAMATLKATFAEHQKREAEQAELERLRQEAAEREQKEREERIAREAEERARREAEAAAQAERDAVARREAEAKAAAEQREREHQAAIERQRREAEAERQRIEDEHRRREEERLAEERRQQDELARRQADKQHRARINRAALEAMIDGGMPEDCAKTAITLIAKGQIPSITINY